MSPPVTYLPAYIGLFASLVLAVACNAFLDIGYGSFGVEIICWSAVFGLTLLVAWRQRGQVDERGLRWQKVGLLLSLVTTLLVFLPIWGLPRAGTYFLAALQASTNCITVNRRKFALALMTSVVMVMFAAAHFRADWTMMFYLVPYLFAVVFTLVAEQISRRARDLRQEGRGLHLAGGQGASILAATSTMIATALFLFSMTPQPTWLILKWKYGQLSNLATFTAQEKGADGGFLEQGGSGGNDPSDPGGGADGKGGPGDQDFANGVPGTSVGDGYRESIGRLPALPTPQEMREAARRPGMPVWQTTVIEELADFVEWSEITLKPLADTLRTLANQTAAWLDKNRKTLLRGLLAFLGASLLGAAYVLFRELPLGLWLRTHIDFLLLGLLGLHARDNRAARQYFAALERLFSFHHVRREARFNTREYLACLHRMHQSLWGQTTDMILLFEKARYSGQEISAEEIARLRRKYREIYEAL